MSKDSELFQISCSLS